MVTMPSLKDITPECEEILYDLLGALVRSGYKGSHWTVDDLKKLQDFLKIK